MISNIKKKKKHLSAGHKPPSLSSYHGKDFFTNCFPFSTLFGNIAYYDDHGRGGLRGH